MSETITSFARSASSSSSPFLFGHGSSDRFNSMPANMSTLQSHGCGSSGLCQFDEEEDEMVDLNTGSLVPVNLRRWNLMAEVIEKLGDL